MAGQKRKGTHPSGRREREFKGRHALEQMRELPSSADFELLRDIERWGFQEIIEAMDWCERRLVYGGDPLCHEELEKVWCLRMLRDLFGKCEEQAHLRRQAVVLVPSSN